jgi:hypothetical protein
VIISSFALVVGDDALAILQSPSSVLIARYWQNPTLEPAKDLPLLLQRKDKQNALLITSSLLIRAYRASDKYTSPAVENDVPSTR